MTGTEFGVRWHSDDGAVRKYSFEPIGGGYIRINLPDTGAQPSTTGYPPRGGFK